MERCMYALLLSIFVLLSLFPLRLLYCISDALAWLLHSVVRYRRKVVDANLRSSFPDKTDAEIRLITRRFYRFLSDYFMETVKLTTMGRRQMSRRMRFEGLEEADKAMAAGHDVTLYLGHYCNWEWVSSLPAHFSAEAVGGQIYHPLENRASDRLFLRIRSRWGAVSIRLHETLKVITRWHREGTVSMVGYIADQVPGYNGIHCWVDFLNHDTPVYSGPERIARMQHSQVYYLDIRRPRRGYYIGKFIKMADDAAECEKFTLTKEYFRLLEESIRRQPQYWLWSHRRWKRTRAAFMARFPDADERLRRL